MKIKKISKHLKNYFLLALFSIFLFSCSDENIILNEKTIKNNTNLNQEITKLKEWINNSTKADAIYKLHQWEKATLEKIDSKNYIIEIPFNNHFKSNQNYYFTVKYIYNNDNYTNRLVAKPIETVKSKKIHPTFVYIFNNPAKLNQLSNKITQKINNYKFVEIEQTLARCSSGCPSSRGSFWRSITDFFKRLGNGLSKITNAIAKFFSSYNNTGTSSSNSSGGYNLYEYETAISNANGTNKDFYKNMLPQEIFWLPQNTSNGNMYHYSQYKTALVNFDKIVNKLHQSYPNINSGYLAEAVLKHHLPNHLQIHINNGNIALIFDYINNQNIIASKKLWKVLQDFIYRFEDTVSHNVKLNEYLKNYNTYKNKILLKSLGFSNINIKFNQTELNYLANNQENGKKIANFVNSNNNSTQAQKFAKEVINVKITNPNANIDFNIEPFINSNNKIDYVNGIKKMTAYLKVRGARELGEYIESLTPLFNSFTIQEVKDIYSLTRKQYLALKGQYMMVIYGTVAEQAYPFIVYAITEATLGAALPLLSRIPVSMVARGVKLEKMIEKVMKMGSPGIKPHVKIFKTHLNPERIAKELFNSLTKNRIGNIKEVAPNVLQANMGNGNYIIYRTVSSTGFEATIEFNFSKFLINGKPSILKFTI